MIVFYIILYTIQNNYKTTLTERDWKENLPSKFIIKIKINNFQRTLGIPLNNRSIFQKLK